MYYHYIIKKNPLFLEKSWKSRLRLSKTDDTFKTRLTCHKCIRKKFKVEMKFLSILKQPYDGNTKSKRKKKSYNFILIYLFIYLFILS